jgi:hypothetical protein
LLSMLKKEIVNVQSYGLCVAPNLYIGWLVHWNVSGVWNMM